ncbi:MAG: plasmid stabilization protein [Xenococcus sp. (in: cyanobacteria)]
MASLTIRNLEDSLKALLRIRAAHHGHSMEEEARQILRAALLENTQPPQNLAETIQKRFAELGGIDQIQIPSRESMREPPKFEP